MFWDAVLAGMSELELQRMWAAERAILDEEGVQLRRIDQYVPNFCFFPAVCVREPNFLSLCA